MKTLSLITVVLALALSVSASAQSEDPSQILLDAERSFQDAVARADESPKAAQASFAMSAAHYQTLVDDHNIESASLYFNLGNARLLSGDVGRAIVNYRKAQRLAPTDPDIKSALNLARGSVAVAVKPTLSDRSVSILTHSLSAIGRPAILVVAGGCWIAAWGMCGLNRLRRTRIRLVPIPALFVLSLIGAGLLVVEQVFVTHARDGVVVWEEVDGRSGPGVGVYDETFDRPLLAGMELTIVSERGDWIEAQLADGRVTWLPKASVEEI